MRIYRHGKFNMNSLTYGIGKYVSQIDKSRLAEYNSRIITPPVLKNTDYEKTLSHINYRKTVVGYMCSK